MKILLKKLTEDIFYISLITYIVYFVLELLKEGFISNYFDLNLFLIWTVVFGVLYSILRSKEKSAI
ncbi:MAG: hypothetical protein ABIJ91_03395 [Candidatus Kuenenbacteria bacterium]